MISEGRHLGRVVRADLTEESVTFAVEVDPDAIHPTDPELRGVIRAYDFRTDDGEPLSLNDGDTLRVDVDLDLP